jgi:hypothetical protein
MQELSQEACRAMIDGGEVPESVRTSGERVAVILTQSWCPQWSAMRRYLDSLDEAGLAVYFVEYDKLPLFAELMAFKETVFANALIPYVRYYRDGRLVSESNAVYQKRRFLKRLES